MSEDLYPVRVRWAQGRGLIRFYDFIEWPTVQPVIPGLSFEEIDWVPALRVAILRPPFGSMRDMWTGEIEDLRKWLVTYPKGSR